MGKVYLSPSDYWQIVHFTTQPAEDGFRGFLGNTATAEIYFDEDAPTVGLQAALKKIGISDTDK